jgi:hypothetical protein
MRGPITHGFTRDERKRGNAFRWLPGYTRNDNSNSSDTAWVEEVNFTHYMWRM